MTFRKLLYRAFAVGRECSGIIQLSARAESSSSCKWGEGAPLVGTYGTGYHPKAEASLFLELFLNAMPVDLGALLHLVSFAVGAFLAVLLLSLSLPSCLISA